MGLIEVYRERLIIYGCGDFLTDYEGVSGYEQFRGNLTLMYLVENDHSLTLRLKRTNPDVTGMALALYIFSLVCWDWNIF